MVFGFVIFFIGYSMTQDPLVRFGRLFSGEYEMQYFIGWLMTLGGGAMAVGGLGLLIYGASQQPKSQEDMKGMIPSHTRTKDNSLPSFRMVGVDCPHCKTHQLLKDNAKFCPNCGKILPMRDTALRSNS